MGDHWVSEAGVTRSTSMEWACWLLGFLLSPDVRVSLLPGALHNREVFDALVGYLRTAVPPASAVVKPRVVGLLSQLLQDPDMFLPEDMPNVRVLCVSSVCVCWPGGGAGALGSISALQRCVEWRPGQVPLRFFYWIRSRGLCLGGPWVFEARCC